MTTETNTDSAQGGAQAQQDQAAGQAAGASPTPAPATPAIPAELQPVVDRIVAERLKRKEEKLLADQQAKATADADAAEAKRLAEEQKWQELARKHEGKAAELETKLRQMEHDQLRRDVAQTAGIPQLWERLQGETAEELAADAKALATMMQPASNQRTATPPTPQAQGGQSDYVRQAIERQQKRATADDPFAAMMKR